MNVLGAIGNGDYDFLEALVPDPAPNRHLHSAQIAAVVPNDAAGNKMLYAHADAS